MPSTPPAQEKTMSAIAHGWKPPAGSDVAKIPLKVAKEFHAADKKRNRWRQKSAAAPAKAEPKKKSLYDHSRKG
jgi:hypothetical protein